VKLLGWLKAVLAVVLGLVIGVAITGVVNLLVPTITIGWTLAAVLVASALSALAGLLAAGRRGKPQASQPKEPAAK
jgi:hypothetical protein